MSTVKASVVVIPANIASGMVKRKRKGTMMAYTGLMRAMAAIGRRKSRLIWGRGDRYLDESLVHNISSASSKIGRCVVYLSVKQEGGSGCHQ